MRRLILSGFMTLTASVLCTSCIAETTPVTSSPAPQVSASAAASPAPSPQGESATVAQAPALSGMFVSGEHPTQGRVTIVTEGNQKFIEFASDFKTDAGPDLVVALHRSDNVIGTTQPPAYSIQESDYTVIAPLQAVSGTQRYDISNLNLADYASVIVWCREFNATFGAAALAAN